MMLSVIMPVMMTDIHLRLITETSLNNLRKFTYPDKIQVILFHNHSEKNPDFRHIKEDAIVNKDDIYIPTKGYKKPTQCFNEGIKLAKSDYIMLLSNSTLLHQDWFKYAKQALDEGIYDFFIPWRHSYTFNEKAYYEELQKAKKEKNYWRGHSFSYGGPSGSVFKRESYEKVGPFNEDLMVFYDREYANRIAEKGLTAGSHLLSLGTNIAAFTRYSENIKEFGWDENKFMAEDSKLGKW